MVTLTAEPLPARLLDWHRATVAVLGFALLVEIGGGYLAYRRRVTEAFDPEVYRPDRFGGVRLLSAPTHILLTPDKIPAWMHLWLKLLATHTRDGQVVRSYVWRFPRVSTDTGIFFRAATRIGAAVFMLVRFSLGHSGF